MRRASRRTALTVAAILAERSHWLRVQVARSLDGGAGWDVVLRLDGTYAVRVDAEEVAAWLRARLDAAPDIPAQRLDW